METVVMKESREERCRFDVNVYMACFTGTLSVASRIFIAVITLVDKTNSSNLFEDCTQRAAINTARRLSDDSISLFLSQK